MANKSRRPLWLSSILFLCLVYFGGMAALWIVSVLEPRWPPWLALLNTFTPFLFSPLIFVLPFAWWARSKTVTAVALAATGFVLMLYGSEFLTQPPPVSAANNDTLTVMTFNLGPAQAQPDQNLSAIEEEVADIVTVQELVPATVSLLREKLSRSYPYSILDLRMGTTGILTRYPIVKSEWFRPAGRGRPALLATLNVNGAPLNVLAIHPLPPRFTGSARYPLPTGLDDEEQELEARDMLRRVALLQDPVLVMGDFNMSDQSQVYGLVSTALKDSYREAGKGFGFTYPNNLMIRGLPVPGPFIRIDYVFHSPQLGAQLAQVSCKGGSDHCYLVVRLGKNGAK